jgi:predicted flap endonuclease-1-like 5' DNA nuclease
MLYLIDFHFVWLLLALIVGGIVGFLTFAGDKAGWSGAGWLILVIPAFLIGLGIAVFKLLPGVAGYWLDLSLLFFGTYIIGCLLGSVLRSLFGGQEQPLPAVVTTTTDVTPSLAAASHPGKMPPVLGVEAASKKDDLKLIKGIGPKNERILNKLGIYTFCQIAAWLPEEAKWMGHLMAFPGRIERELWIDQAKILCAGGETEHSIAVRGGLVVNDEAIDDREIAKLKSGMPELMGQVAGEDKHEGKRPFGMVKPRGGVADDLKLINGIGKQNEAHLHGLGIWHFNQIALWTRANIDWVGSFLAFPGRIDREQWVEQAKVLERGSMTAFAERVKRGEVATSMDDGSKGQDNVETIKS